MDEDSKEIFKRAIELGINYYVDVYQIHSLDAFIPMYIGASTIFAWQIEHIQNVTAGQS